MGFCVHRGSWLLCLPVIRTGGMERNESGHQYHTQWCMYHALKHYIWYIDSRNTFGVYCSIDTSRIIRVCYWYLCDTQCCCITGTCIHMYNTQNNTGLKWHTWFQFWHRIWLDCCVGGRNRLDFCAEDRNWLDFSVGIGIHLVSVWGLKMTWCRVWIEINLACCVRGHRNWLRFCFGRNFMFLCGGQNGVGFCVRAENDLLFLWGSIDSVLCWWSKLTWFLYAGRKSLCFSSSIEIDLVFVWEVELDLIWV